MKTTTEIIEEFQERRWLIGYYTAKGACELIINNLCRIVIILWISSFLLRASGCFQDDTDASRWKPSGLKPLTDAKTGVQYLSDGNGGLIIRATSTPANP